MAIRQKGTKWQVDVTVKGARAPRVSCDSRPEAERVEAEFKAALLRGVPPEQLTSSAAPSRPSKGTLGDLLDATYKSRWVGSKAEASSLRNGDAWCLELGHDFPLAQLGPAVVAEVCDKWAVAGNKSATINRKLAALSVMLGVADERGLIEKRFRLPKRKEYEGRLRWFSDEEADSLIDHVAGQHDLVTLFEAALDTGLRQGELLGLTKRDVDVKHKLVLLGRTKGNQRRSVPLTSRALSALQEAAANKLDHEKLWPDWVTCRHISRVIAAWKHKRGLPPDDEACFHTFRHTACSRLVQRGVPITVVQKFMGHASIQTTMRYAHLAPDSLDLARAALERAEA